MIRLNYLYLVVLLNLFTGCNTPPDSSPYISPKTHSISKAGNVSILTFSEDKFFATITIPHGSQSVGPILKKLMADDNTNVLDQYLDGTVNEDTAPEIKDVIINHKIEIFMCILLLYPSLILLKIYLPLFFHFTY